MNLLPLLGGLAGGVGLFLLGMGLILSGVVIMNVFSNAGGH